MPRSRTIVIAFLVVSMLVAARIGAQVKRKPDVWKPLRVLVGSWEGQGEGRPGVSRLEREYEFVLQDKFLQVKNKSLYEPPRDNLEEKEHEDWGLFSYDENRGKLVFRQFHTEGYVNRYVLDSLSDGGRTLVFVTESIENFWPNWRARETYRIISDDEFIETFELAPPDKDFELYMTNHLKRKR